MAAQQEAYIDDLAQACKASNIVLHKLDFSDQMVIDLLQAVRDFLHHEYPDEKRPDGIALAITGLEASILLDGNEAYPAVLQLMNLARDRYPMTLPYPFHIWLSDRLLRKVQLAAPDFWSGRSGEPVRFAATPDFLDREIARALALGPLESWNDAVARVSRLERLLEEYGKFEHPADTEFEVLSRLGDAYKFLEKYPKARDVYQKAIALSAGEGRASALNKLGIVMRAMKEWDGALELFQEYLTFAQKRDDRIGQGAAFNNIGLIYLEQGKIRDAERALEQALSINQQTENPQALSNTLGNIGLAHHQQGHLDGALEYYRRSLEMSRKLDTPESFWKDLMNLGAVYDEKGEFETAFRYYSDATEVSHRHGDLIGEKRGLIHLAQCASRMEGNDPIRFYEDALALARKTRDGESEYLILTGLAETHRKGDVAKALLYYEKAVEVAQELGAADEELACYVALIQLHGRGVPEQVSRYKEKAKLLLRGAGKIKMLNAWLIDARGQIPGVLVKDDRYTLCLNIGDIPERYLASTEAGKKAIAQVEFIYDLVANRDGGAHEPKGFAKPIDAPPPAPVEKPVVSSPSSDRGQEVIADAARPAGAAGRVYSERLGLSESLSISVNGERLDTFNRRTSISVQVNIEGIGFDCKRSSDTLKTSWEGGSDVLAFLIIPREVGENKRVAIRCEANGVPFDTTLLVKVEESHVQQVRTGGTPVDLPLLPKFFFNPVERDAEYILIDGAKERIVFESTGVPAPDYPLYFAKYPVTNALYRRFIDYLAGRSEDETLAHLRREDYAESLWTRAQKIQGFTDYLKRTGPARWASRFRSHYDDDRRFNGEDQPVVGVTWYAAMAYCHWLTELSEIEFRLPTEGEWEWAASGGTRAYPWGNEEPDETRANYDGKVGPTPVDAYPAGATPEGLMDMAGNVWEWMENSYKGDIWRALRGGGWQSESTAVLCAARFDYLPTYDWLISFGFRVVCRQSGF
ncbi:tetratricopeptide repeat protein [Candidatus Poribacteria bacterium]|nr:tetratricopeptide repeat protein [Candidatus Poribacteria bacterium]